MTAVSVAYIAYDKLFLNLSVYTAHMVGFIVALVCLIGFLLIAPKCFQKSDFKTKG